MASTKGKDTGGTQATCGKAGCTRVLFVKPTTIAVFSGGKRKGEPTGKLFHQASNSRGKKFPSCFPKGSEPMQAGSIPKAVTVAAWTAAERRKADQVAKRKAEREAAKAEA